MSEFIQVMPVHVSVEVMDSPDAGISEEDSVRVVDPVQAWTFIHKGLLRPLVINRHTTDDVPNAQDFGQVPTSFDNRDRSPSKRPRLRGQSQIGLPRALDDLDKMPNIPDCPECSRQHAHSVSLNQQLSPVDALPVHVEDKNPLLAENLSVYEKMQHALLNGKFTYPALLQAQLRARGENWDSEAQQQASALALLPDTVSARVLKRPREGASVQDYETPPFKLNFDCPFEGLDYGVPIGSYEVSPNYDGYAHSDDLGAYIVESDVEDTESDGDMH